MPIKKPVNYRLDKKILTALRIYCAENYLKHTHVMERALSELLTKEGYLK